MIRKCNIDGSTAKTGNALQTGRLHTGLLLTLIFLFSLLLKIFCFAQEPLITTDGTFYVQLIRVWSQTDSYAAMVQFLPKSWWLPPLPLWCVKVLSQTGLTVETAGLLLAFVLGGALSVIAYGIAFEVTQNRKIAIASALLLTLHPTVNELGREIQRDIFYLFFSGCAIWFFCSAVQRKKWYLLCGAAVCCAAAALSRFETLEFLPIIVFSLFLLVILKYITWRRAIAWGAGFFCVFFITIFLFSSAMDTNDFLRESYREYVIHKWNRLFPQWRITL